MSSSRPPFEHDQLAHRLIVPFRSEILTQALRLKAGRLPQPFERYQPIAETQPYTDTKARLVGPAQYPSITPHQRMRPQIALPRVEVDIGHLHSELGAL